jgi:hypothetical protein
VGGGGPQPFLALSGWGGIMRLIIGFLCVGGAAVLGLVLGSSFRGRDPQPLEPGAAGLPAPAASLRGTLFCEKSQRLVLHWEKGDFELWDTEQGCRVGRVERLSRPIDWCIASPDEATVLTGDRMPRWSKDDALKAQLDESFVPTVHVWDVKSGARKHAIRVPEAMGHAYYVHEWHARWLEGSRVLIVRLLRENSVRAASRLRLIVVDTAAGKVVKVSEDFKFAGEHLLLSPDRKMAVVKDDNYWRRKKDGDGLEGHYRNIYAQTHVFDLERLTVLSAVAAGMSDSSGQVSRWV